MIVFNTKNELEAALKSVQEAGGKVGLGRQWGLCMQDMLRW